MAKVEGSAAVKGTSSPHSRYGGIPFRGPLHLRLLPAALNASSIPETSLQLDFTHPLTVDMQKTTGIQTWGQGCNLNRLPILPTYLCSASTSYDRSPRGLVVAKGELESSNSQCIRDYFNSYPSSNSQAQKRNAACKQSFTFN